MSLSVVRNLSLADQVFQLLASAILSSRYAPGQMLPAERKLVETFKVNRHVVREALKRLEQIGLVRITQGGGSQVLDFHKHAGLDLLALMADYSHAQEEAMGFWLAVHEMRAVIASDAARLCALRATPELKQELVEIGDRMRAIGDGPEVYTLEIHYWDRVLEGAGNIAYRLAFNSLVKGTHTPAVMEIARIWGIFEVKQSDYHAELSAAIMAGDAELAESSSRKVVRAVTEALARVVRTAVPRPAPSASEPPALVELQASSVRRRTKKGAAEDPSS
jgi:GntR family transcriptional repressor for pyruvate dehydrogenase complex